MNSYGTSRYRSIRSRLGALLVAGLTAGTLAGCGTSAGTADDEKRVAWSFSDDSGTTVELDSAPTRVVMWEDIAASMMDFGVRPAAIFGQNKMEDNPLFGGDDMSGITSLGRVCGEIDIEKLASLEPDLIVAMQWGPYDKESFCVKEDQLEDMKRIAPVLRMQSEKRADNVLADYVDLAAALGADLTSGDVAGKKKAYEDAQARLKAAVKSRPEIAVSAMSVSSQWIGIATTKGFPDLDAYDQTYGVTFVEPKKHDGYWQELDHETADRYRADIVLVDSRSRVVTESLPSLRKESPVWGALPEIAAGQVVPWFVPGSFSYTRDADALNTLAEAIENAEDIV